MTKTKMWIAPVIFLAFSQAMADTDPLKTYEATTKVMDGKAPKKGVATSAVKPGTAKPSTAAPKTPAKAAASKPDRAYCIARVNGLALRISALETKRLEFKAAKKEGEAIVKSLREEYWGRAWTEETRIAVHKAEGARKGAADALWSADHALDGLHKEMAALDERCGLSK
ncbi:MAG: hypothetical protein HYT79_07000 [Elusimicrobia bacterium]|nr:hypothetical protein [Elusimicrobiota bacterium]